MFGTGLRHLLKHWAKFTSFKFIIDSYYAIYHEWSIPIDTVWENNVTFPKTHCKYGKQTRNCYQKKKKFAKTKKFICINNADFGKLLQMKKTNTLE